MRLKKLFSYVRLARLNKPIGIFLLLWPTLIALWIAGNGSPDLVLVGIFVLGVVVMRSAGCVINDLIDRKIDKHVARTKERPLATGMLTPKEAVAFFIFLLVIAVLLVLLLNSLTIQISLIAIALTVIYPFMKRYTYFPQLILGAAFGIAVPMAFAALTEHVPLQAFILYFATLVWAVIYDTEYAMVDRVHDQKIGLKSTAILFGKGDRLIIAILQGIFLMTLIYLGFFLKLNIVYYLGLGGVLCFFIYQQYLIKDRKPEQCFKAFLNNHWVGAFWFLGIALQ
jgi:4-hydroxybenzoate polyprenyltransferase